MEGQGNRNLNAKERAFILVIYNSLAWHWWFRQWKIFLQCRKPGFDPWVGKIPWRREWLPTLVFWPRTEEPVGLQSTGSKTWTWQNHSHFSLLHVEKYFLTLLFMFYHCLFKFSFLFFRSFKFIYSKTNLFIKKYITYIQNTTENTNK